MDKEAAPTMVHHHEKLPPPHAYVKRIWDSEFIRDALAKSRASLDRFEVLGFIRGAGAGAEHDRDHRGLSHLIRVTDVRKLFLIDSSRVAGTINYLSSVGLLEWGTKDIMIDLGDPVMPPEWAADRRMEYLRDAAKFKGRSICRKFLS